LDIKFIEATAMDTFVVRIKFINKYISLLNLLTYICRN